MITVGKKKTRLGGVSLGMLDFEEERTEGYLSILSSSMVVQIRSKMIYDAKCGDDFVRGRTAPGLVGIRQPCHCGASRGGGAMHLESWQHPSLDTGPPGGMRVVRRKLRMSDSMPLAF